MKKLMMCLCLAMMFCAAAFAQSTETVLYSFAGAPDGGGPAGGMLFDSSGNIYGVTLYGGSYCQANGGCGTVFELSPSAMGWTESILYSFCPSGGVCPDGASPQAGLISDASGNLYGTTTGGGASGDGTVYRLNPPTGGGNWTETVLWNFAEGKPGNGQSPQYGRLNMDAAGNLYGATLAGGKSNLGTVFELSPAGNGTYTFSILHSFLGGRDGSNPAYGVSFDASGNLYGTTYYGGSANAGVVYGLTPANGVWKETVLYHFNGKTGAHPVSNVSIGESGNLYGTFEQGGVGDCSFGTCGGVFELKPQSGAAYKASTFLFDGSNGGNPMAGVLVEKEAGFAYGTTSGAGLGNVFKLQGKVETVLYSFCSLKSCADGSTPSPGALVDHQGLLYGETGLGGAYKGGVIYSLTK
ncbi:MAG: choice-of-anchor tandem repeat GloVer-containing protein [Terriglobales bacterium]